MQPWITMRPKAIRYYTMLENYDDVWREAIGDKMATFINVPPGKYTFRVKSFNIDGIKSEKAISIIIDPPWWKTWWAYVIYGLLILAFAVFMNRMLRNLAVQAGATEGAGKGTGAGKGNRKSIHRIKSNAGAINPVRKNGVIGRTHRGCCTRDSKPLKLCE